LKYIYISFFFCIEVPVRESSTVLFALCCKICVNISNNPVPINLFILCISQHYVFKDIWYEGCCYWRWPETNKHVCWYISLLLNFAVFIHSLIILCLAVNYWITDGEFLFQYGIIQVSCRIIWMINVKTEPTAYKLDTWMESNSCSSSCCTVQPLLEFVWVGMWLRPRLV
jgi:hypothetical protein